MAGSGYTPDKTQRDSAPYWGAVLAQAIRDGDGARRKLAQKHLERLGVPLTVDRRKAVRRG